MIRRKLMNKENEMIRNTISKLIGEQMAKKLYNEISEKEFDVSYLSSYVKSKSKAQNFMDFIKSKIGMHTNIMNSTEEHNTRD